MSIGNKSGVLDPSGGILASVDETTWDFMNKFVERASFADGVVTSQSSLILAGPALYVELSEVGDDVQTKIAKASLLTPIGFVQDFRYRESQQVNRHFEIGSGEPRFTVGKSTGSGTIARAFFDADSLLAVLMRNASKVKGAPHVSTFFNNSSDFQYGFGLSSDAFKIPFGIANVYKTIGNDFVASGYIEECYIRDHTVAVNERAPLVMEKVSLEFDRVRTVNIRVAGPSGIQDNNA